MSAFPNAHDFTIDGGIFNAGVRTQIINLKLIGTQYFLNKDDPPRGIVETLDDQTLSLLPLDKVHIDVCVVDGNVYLANLKYCCALNIYNSISMCNAETDFYQSF